MKPVITSIIDSALAGVRARLGDDAAAAGLVSALSHVRALVGRQGGPALRAELDAGLQRLVLGARMRPSAGVEPAALPGAIEFGRRARADAILIDAALSCVAFNKGQSDNSVIALTAETLADRLIQTLKGAPDWSALVGAMTPLRSDDEGEGDGLDHLMPSRMIH